MTTPFAALLFDCDGVLVDSEPITHRVLQHSLHDLGWQLTLADCEYHFMGRAIQDQSAKIAQETGVVIDHAWLQAFRARRDEALLRELQAIEHAVEVVKGLHAHYPERLACVSGADRGKVGLQGVRDGVRLDVRPHLGLHLPHRASDRGVHHLALLPLKLSMGVGLVNQHCHGLRKWVECGGS